MKVESSGRPAAPSDASGSTPRDRRLSPGVNRVQVLGVNRHIPTGATASFIHAVSHIYMQLMYKHVGSVERFDSSVDLTVFDVSPRAGRPASCRRPQGE